mmetsp:Transcript_15318/g.42839  ORF Transcript_15318/g.42839 Transcript_15318/m.42839 type:complete len:103 (+) Transcript_15318:55-363(+)
MGSASSLSRKLMSPATSATSLSGACGAPCAKLGGGWQASETAASAVAMAALAGRNLCNAERGLPSPLSDKDTCKAATTTAPPSDFDAFLHGLHPNSIQRERK